MPKIAANQTAKKAHVAAALTLVTYVLALFGLGEVPAPETVTEAAAQFGGALVMAGLTWIATWAATNRDKKPSR